MFTKKPPITTATSSDLDQMPETPHRMSHHRRSQSESFLHFPPDLLLDADIDLIDSMAVEDSSNCHNNTSGGRPSAMMSQFRSLSVDADFFDNLGFSNDKSSAEENLGFRTRHGHSNSMDGSITSSSFEDDYLIMDGVKKAMPPDRLAQLALIDPKRAKRILANRQSAARSKERKTRYTGELERKVQTLQTEATTLSAQVTMLQRDTAGLTTENKELKIRFQAMEQQAHLRDALIDALREEVQRLKIESGHISSVNGNFNRGYTPQSSVNGNFNRGYPPQSPQYQHTSPCFGNNQNQQPQPPASNQDPNRSTQARLSDFNQRV